MSTCLSTLAAVPSLCCLSPSDAPCAEDPMAERAEVLCEGSPAPPAAPRGAWHGGGSCCGQDLLQRAVEE